MAVLTTTTVGRDSADIAALLVACEAGGDSFTNTGVEFLVFQNTNAATRTITMVTQALIDGQAVADKTFVIEATTGLRIVGPFPPGVYNDGNGRVSLTYSADTNLKVAVFKLSTT